MLTAPTVSEQQIREFERDGFLVIRGAFTGEDMVDMEFVPCPTGSADVMFFDSYAPHASDPNMSERSRRVYYATYNGRSEGDHMARYHADKHKNFPPDIDREPGKEYVFRV